MFICPGLSIEFFLLWGFPTDIFTHSQSYHDSCLPTVWYRVSTPTLVHAWNALMLFELSPKISHGSHLLNFF